MINVSYGWFILLFSKGKSCSAVIKCITLFSTLYLLVTATSPKCTLPLEKMIIFAGVVVFIGIHYANEWNHCGEECAVQVRSLTLALGSLWCVSSLQASLQMPSSTTLAGNSVSQRSCSSRATKGQLARTVSRWHPEGFWVSPWMEMLVPVLGHPHSRSVSWDVQVELSMLQVVPMMCVWRSVAVREGGGWASSPNKYPCYTKLSIC